MADRRRETLRKRKLEKRRQLRITLLCIVGGISAILVSLALCLLFFPRPQEEGDAGEITSVSLPYDKAQPFSISDVTPEQLRQIREQGRIRISDGPREISIGDSLEKILDHYPSQYNATDLTEENTGEQSDEMQILYCSAYYRNNDGKMTALPPRGLLNVDSGQITITLLAPTSPYPAGTKDDYGKYEHIYCIYTIDPDSMGVSSIVLGIDR